MADIPEKTHKIERSMRKLKQINLWGVLATFVFIGLLCMLGYYGYMHLELGKLEKQVAQEEERLSAKNKEYNILRNKPLHKKYESAQYIEKNKATIEWKETFTYLIGLFDQLDAVDDSMQGVELQDFSLGLDYNMSLRGTIDDVRKMYLPNGLLDQLTAFEFIEHIEIPFYRRSGEEQADIYNFVLDATIKTNDGN